MENFIVVLLSIGFVIYNIYKNYLKEMEKSNARKPNARPQPIPSFDTNSTNTPQKKIEAKSKNIEKAYVPELPEEVKAAQLRKKLAENQAVKNQTKKLEVESPTDDIEFDLRKAVIQAAILERPYN